MAHQSRPEPMNASPHHPKVKVSLTFSDPYYLAGSAITGKMEVESRADVGLGLGIIMVELFAIEELTSRDHSATSTFIHARRLFQGQGLPPSNAVLPHPAQDYPALPAHYYQAQRGSATFLFQLPLPSSAPNAIDFGQGLARVRYEVRATVGVAWKGENRLVVDTREVDVLESYELDFDRIEPEGVVVGEHGKIWVQAKVVGGLVVAGESACVELQVKNHSSKKTTGLSVTLERHLQLCGLPPNQKAPLQISDTLTTVKFRGPEYIAYPGVEGVAQLVFDVPRSARTVKAGDREGDDPAVRPKPPIFEVRCLVKVTMSLPIGSKDIQLDLPVTIYHPAALPPPEPEPPLSQPFGSPVYDAPFYPAPPEHGYAHSPIPFDRAQSPYAYPFTPPPVPVPAPQPYYDPAQQQWFMPPPAHSPYPYYSPPAQAFSPPPPGAYAHPHAQYYYHPHPAQPLVPPPRPASAEPVPSSPLHSIPSGLPPSGAQHPLLPLLASSTTTTATTATTATAAASAAAAAADVPVAAAEDAQEGKGERASRVAHHLRMSSRHRSVSPTSHRFALPASASIPAPLPIPVPVLPTSLSAQAPPTSLTRSLSPLHSPEVEVHSPRPLPSPTRVPTTDPFAAAAYAHTLAHSLPKSGRVEALERMAAAVDGDLSHDLPKRGGAVEKDKDKTLPKPPVPSGKVRLLGPGIGPQRPRADQVFALADAGAGVEADADADVDLEADANVDLEAMGVDMGMGMQDDEPPQACPKTPTLSALSMLKPSSHPNPHPHALSLSPPAPPSALLNPGAQADADAESGLDALERRLLAEVGTRKLDAAHARATVLPIAIPSAQADVGGELNDSAISSLTLGAEEGVGGGAGPAGDAAGIGAGAGAGSKFERERAREWERVGVAGADADEGECAEEGIEHEHEHEHEHENDRISDERTQKQGRSHSGESDRGTRKGKGARSTASSGKGSHGKKKRKKRKEERDEDAARLRSAAKGRVAEWLGRLEVPAADEEPVAAGEGLDLVDAEADVEAFRNTGAVSPGGRSPMLSPLEGRSEAGKVSPAASPRVSRTPVDGLPAVPPLPDFVMKRPASREVLDAKASPSTSPSARKAEPAEPEPKPDAKEADASAKPNPRSSGFVPISTLRENPQPRNSRFISRPDPGLPKSAHNPTSPRARYEAALKSSSPPPPPPVGAKNIKKADQKRWPAFPPQPQGDAPAKYDVRSARGGRGGKVTAVTAIWATAAAGAGADNAVPAKKPTAKPIVAPKPKPAPPAKPTVAHKPAVPPSKPIPATKPTPVPSSKPTPAATPRPAYMKTPTLASYKPPPPGKPRTFLDLPKAKPSMATSGPPRTSPHASPSLGPAKGASVPAIVSSSLATPMISSTASLSRPTGQEKKLPSPRLPPAIPEIPATGRVVSPASKAAGEDLAFGQARLRDLIRKYQGQTA
ncbi:hypothetical protein DENSPDRAFT_926422 [Dentipellis sp. KUC8613]|nr:hypothetical protein DENSPDRAFT_926422 [Dentipellis sp. KUC8613]